MSQQKTKTLIIKGRVGEYWICVGRYWTFVYSFLNSRKMSGRVYIIWLSCNLNKIQFEQVIILRGQENNKYFFMKPTPMNLHNPQIHKVSLYGQYVLYIVRSLIAIVYSLHRSVCIILSKLWRGIVLLHRPKRI